MKHQPKRRIVDTTKIKKHSDIIKKIGYSLHVSGDRIATNTGFIVPGTKCADYETTYEVMLERTYSNKVVHPTKTKSYRILSGNGSAVFQKDDKTKTVTLVPGDEVSIPPGITYQISTASKTYLEFISTASADY